MEKKFVIVPLGGNSFITNKPQSARDGITPNGWTGWNDENSHVIEYSLKLDSNPEFTSSVIVAYARAAYRMNQEGQKGCKTVFDVAPAYLSALDGAELRKKFL